MKAITYTAARQNLATTMEEVCKDHAPVIITRKKSDSVVIMSLEDYEALEETAYLFRSWFHSKSIIILFIRRTKRSPAGVSETVLNAKRKQT